MRSCMELGSVPPSMGDTPLRVEDAGDWDDLPFQLPPLPFRGRVRRTLTEIGCFVGILAAKTVRALRPDRKAVVPRKILVIRRGGLGDVLMATPLLRGIRDHFPSAWVFVLTSKQD